MKNRAFKIVFYLSFSFLIIISFLFNLYAVVPDRAIWIWDSSKEFLYDVGDTRQDLWDFCNAPPGGAKIKTIYFNVSASELELVPGDVQSFVQEAHDQGFLVYWLGGDPSWGQTNDNGAGKRAIDNVVLYNSNSTSNQRFDGVDLDIKPYTYSEYWYENPGVFGDYLGFLTYASNELEKCKTWNSNFKFGCDIPYYYDESPCTDQYKDVIDKVDYVSIIGFSDSAYLLSIQVTNELSYCESLNKKVRIGIDTYNLGDAYFFLTFYEEGWKVMESTVSNARTNWSKYSSYECEVIHCCLSYRSLFPSRINATVNTNISSVYFIPGQTNKTVLSLHISSDTNFTYLKGAWLKNSGNADENDITAVKLWLDNGTVTNFYDSGDTLIGVLNWDSLHSAWTNNKFSITNYLGPDGISCVFTINIASGAVSGRTFKAKISQNNIFGNAWSTGSSNNIENDYFQTIFTPSTNKSGLRINELLINASSLSPPADREPYFEWIEIYNTSSNVVDLSGCLLGDTVPLHHFWQIPDNTYIEPYSYKVFWGYQFNPTLNTNTDMALINNNTSSSEIVKLFDPQTNLIDSFNYQGLNALENDIFMRKLDGYGSFYTNSTNIHYSDSWVTSYSNNTVGTTNYLSTRGKPNGGFKLICTSGSNRVPMNGSLSITIKASNYLDGKIVTNYSGSEYLAQLYLDGGSITPDMTTSGFNQGVWQGDIIFHTPGVWTMTAQDRGIMGNLSFFTVYSPHPVHYVSKITNNPVYPYDTPGTAATNIQDAIDAADSLDEVVIIDNYTNYSPVVINNYQYFTLKADDIFIPIINGRKIYINGCSISNAQHVTVQGIEFRNALKQGIYLKNSEDCRIYNNTCISNKENGILVDTVQGCDFFNNISSSNIYSGIMIIDGTGNTVSTNITSFNHKGGIVLLAQDGVSTNNTISYNYSRKNTIAQQYSGIYLGKADKNIILYNETWDHKDNTAYDKHGISLSNSHQNYIRGNLIAKNFYGILLDKSSHNNSIVSNYFYNNTGIWWPANGAAGIHITGGSDNNIISYNRLRFNSRGVQIYAGKDNMVFKNEFIKNMAFGIQLWGAEDTQIINNTFLLQNDQGVFIRAGTSGTVFKNLIFAPNGTCINTVEFGNAFYHCLMNPPYGANITIDESCITNIDPQFKSVTVSTEDLYLKFNSPAIGTAQSNIVSGAMGAHTAWVKPGNAQVIVSTPYTITFTTSFSNLSSSGSIPADGRIILTFPDGFNVSQAYYSNSSSSWGGSKGGFSVVDISAQKITIQRDGSGNPSRPGESENIILGGIVNCPDAKQDCQIKIETTDNNGNLIERMYSNDFLIYDVLHHFTIIHDGTGVVDRQERVHISSCDIYDNILSEYTGTITIDVKKTVFSNSIIWSNITGNGTLNFIGSNRATYQFVEQDNGVVTLALYDSTAETLDIEVSNNTSITDDDSEGPLIIYPHTLHHFTISHDGYGIISQPESVVITAYDIENYIISDYAGDVTLTSDGLGTISWTSNPGNQGSLTNLANNLAIYWFDAGDQGVVTLNIIDDTEETINITCTDGDYSDDDTEGGLGFSLGNFYVDNIAGDDSNNGTSWADAFATIQKAVDSYISGYPAKIYVLGNGPDNAYTNTNKNLVYIDKSGFSKQEPLEIISYPTNGFKAVIDGRYVNTNCFHLYNASFIKIKGFVIKRAIEMGIFLNRASQNNIIFSNEVCSNRWRGIGSADGGGNAGGTEILYNMVHNNGEPGLWHEFKHGIFLVTDFSGCIIKHNEIFDQSESGISLRNNNDTVIISNEIYNNGSHGIILHDNCDNNIVQFNKVHNNTNCGVYCGDHYGTSDQNLIRNNEVYSNSDYGLCFRGNNNIASSNRVYGNNKGGVYFQNNSYIDNICRSNQIYQNQSYAVKDDTEDIMIFKNQIYNNEEGVQLNGSVSSIVLSNQIYGNTNNGISIYNKSMDGRIIDNNIKDNAEGGIQIIESTNFVIKNNMIHNNGLYSFGLLVSGYGLYISDNASANLVSENHVYNNYDAVQIGNNAKENTFAKNLIYNSINYGTVLSNNAGVNKIINNTYYNNDTGISLDGTISGSVLKNNISSSNNTGIESVNPVAVSNSLFNDSLNLNGTVTLKDCITNQDPLFRSTLSGSEEFYLNWNSPCINKAQSNTVAGCMGRYTGSLHMTNDGTGKITSHRLTFTTSLSNGGIPDGAYIIIDYIEKVGSSDFGLSKITSATTTSAWGGGNISFNGLNGNDPLQRISMTYNGNPIPGGRTENIIISSVSNGSPSRDYQVIVTIQSNMSEGVIERLTSNYFAVISASNVLEYFTIIHDGMGTVNIPEQVVITAYDIYDNIITNYSGDITLTTTGAGNISWISNSGNQGQLTNLSVNTAVYNFSVNDNGVVTLSIVDDTVESLNIAVFDSGKYDEDTEGFLNIIYNGQFFVDNITGDDTDDGLTWATAFATIQKAVDSCVDNLPGTVHVRGNGTAVPYTNTTLSNYVVKIDKSGLDADNLLAIVSYKSNNLDAVMAPCSGAKNTNGLCFKGAEYVMLKGFDIKGFTNGINLDLNSYNNIIQGNTCYSNRHFGIISLGRDQIIRSNVIIDNGDRINTNEQGFYTNGGGLYFEGSDTVVVHNKFSNNVYGLFAKNGDNSRIVTNIFYESLNKMLYLYDDCDNYIIISNKICQGSTGIYIQSSDSENVVIKNNVIYSNTFNGIYSSGINNTIMSNEIYGNPGNGICTLGAGAEISYNDIHHNSSAKEAYKSVILFYGASTKIRHNLIYSNFQSGVFARTADYSSIVSNKISYNFGIGSRGILLLHNCDYFTIVSNQIWKNGDKGIEIVANWNQPSDYNYVYNNLIYSNSSDGIKIDNCSKNTLINNIIFGNDQFGINFEKSDQHLFISNICANNDNSGIFLYQSRDSIFEDNIIYSNTGNGIGLSQATNNLIVENQLYGHTGASCSGIVMGNESINNMINRCIVKDNYYGVVVYNSSGNMFQKNLVYNNSDDGFYLGSNADNCSVVNNTIYNNDNGIYCDGTIDNCIFNNNIFASNNVGFNTGSAVVVSNSCFWDDTDYTGSVTLMSCITAQDPLFKNTSSLTQDFHLQYNSPCINSALGNTVAGCMGFYTASVRIDDCVMSAVSQYTITFTTSCSNGSIPSDGRILITFDNGFDISGANGTSPKTSSFWGGGVPTFSASVSGQTVVVNRTGGQASIPGQTENLIITNIQNHNMPDTIYRVSIETRENDDTTIEGPLVSNDFQVCYSNIPVVRIVKTVRRVEMYGNNSTSVPGSSITYQIFYDNDSISSNIKSSEIIDLVPLQVEYVSNSASISNSLHAGTVQIKVWDSTDSWVDETNAVGKIDKIKWIFSTNIQFNNNDEGTDSYFNCDGDFPDDDAGCLTYKVRIK